MEERIQVDFLVFNEVLVWREEKRLKCAQPFGLMEFEMFDFLYLLI